MEFVSTYAGFVDNYWSSFAACHSFPMLDSNNKGKGVLSRLRIDSTPPRTQVIWQPPSSDYIMVNIDTNFVGSISATSIGFVARDSSGNFVGFYWVMYKCVGSGASGVPCQSLYRYHFSQSHYFRDRLYVCNYCP